MLKIDQLYTLVYVFDQLLEILIRAVSFVKIIYTIL